MATMKNKEDANTSLDENSVCEIVETSSTATEDNIVHGLNNGVEGMVADNHDFQSSLADIDMKSSQSFPSHSVHSRKHTRLDFNRANSMKTIISQPSICVFT